MPRSRTFRFLAILLGAFFALAAPGQALAHGEAHHEAVEHHAPAIGGETHSHAATVSSTDHDHAHEHPRLDGTPRTRVDALSGVPALPVLLPDIPLMRPSLDAPARRDELARGEPPTGPPPRLRAPPSR